MGAIPLTGMIGTEVLDYRCPDQTPKVATVTTLCDSHKRKDARDVERIDIAACRCRARYAPTIPIFIEVGVVGREVGRKPHLPKIALSYFIVP